MAQFFASIGVGCVLFALWRSEGIASALGGVFFFISGGWFYSGSTESWDLMAVSGFAMVLFGGVVLLLTYLSRPKGEDLSLIHI